MKKMILTSSGLVNKKLQNVFLDYVGKDPRTIKILFITSARATSEELHHIEKSRQELLPLGAKEENFTIFQLEVDAVNENTPNHDVIYVCGGNTFYILKYIRESGLDKIIINHVNSGKTYVGVSAGSILVGPSIDFVDVWDPNDVKLENKNGLNLVNFLIAPHFTESESRVVEEIRKRIDYELITLCDGEAMVVNGEKVEKI